MTFITHTPCRQITKQTPKKQILPSFVTIFPLFCLKDIGSSSELSLERLHDLAVDMARKKRHSVLDHHATAIQAVASAQSNSFLWETENLTTNKPRSRTNSSGYSNKSSLKFADEDTDSNDVNRRFTSIDSFRLSGPPGRRASDQKLIQLKKNKDDIDINNRFSDDIGRRKKTASVDIFPDGEVSLPVRNFLFLSFFLFASIFFYMMTIYIKRESSKAKALFLCTFIRNLPLLGYLEKVPGYNIKR